ncbi:hypothetical protein PHYBLDRAFT_180388 [Phycomyces blakesleeanus NRRL 1555(-)]|uniref:DASH complex subunit DAM1 n=1 Tax=Phycomyces blakesleeanus (strain ATCC 8743b / DSM 1359 / FGSC 10004 / NBRC 33097 / NRRL 1555) TaxID=763407 RepID=A0A167P4J6_PHYB8|nr:hypothetical protein PHYBLDRAFT_180388 [Phycomyces blakesleeanus NRRL 1555(-)]OAD77234.1 hypothetical protein PHYBLDRAFT_180388 [Phycomyces blakesleeanus NRRL 1555(-)]|eukprot:XP_018295274.1 hypothetical protein PHYBLDRAFT_180388 [Phycomyces blakesleeanus NRRL 1555(-)]
MPPKPDADNPTSTSQNETINKPTGQATFALPQPIYNSDPQSTRFDELGPRLRALADEFAIMERNLGKLKEVGTSFDGFNRSFGAFIFGLSTIGGTVDWPQAPVKESFENHSHLQRPFVSDLSAVHNTTIEDIQPSDKSPAQEKTKDTIKRITKRNSKETPSRPIIRTGPRTSNKSTGNPASKISVAQSNRFTRKLNTKKIIEQLPIEFRDKKERFDQTKLILESLMSRPDGALLDDIVKSTELPKYAVTVCLNALVHRKHVAKLTQKGQYSIFKMDPVRYPTTEINPQR